MKAAPIRGLPFRSSVLTISAAALVLLSAVVFVVRTVPQPHYEPCDFAVFYAGSRAWLAGSNPYDGQASLQCWVQAGGQADVMPDGAAELGGWCPVLQVAPALSLFAPLAVLPAPRAVIAWYALAAALLLAQTAALASMIGTRLWRPTGLVLMAATLTLAPVHDCFGWGQPSGPAISLIILAGWAAWRRRDVTAGLLLGLASALKPQLGGVFVLYYLLTGRGRMVYTSAAVMLVLTLIAVIPMEFRGTPWLTAWLHNLNTAESHPMLNSTAPANPGRVGMVNLQVILLGLLDEKWVADLLAVLLTAGLGALFAWRRGVLPGRHDELLSLAVVATLALLPVYHRFYDAAIMVVPIAWGLAHLRGRPLWAWGALLLGLSFIVPNALIPRLARLSGLNPATASGVWWDALVEPARVWLLLAGVAWLIAAVGGRKRTGAREALPVRIHDSAAAA